MVWIPVIFILFTPGMAFQQMVGMDYHYHYHQYQTLQKRG